MEQTKETDNNKNIQLTHINNWIDNFEKNNNLKFILLVESGAYGRKCQTKHSDFDLKGFYIAQKNCTQNSFKNKKDQITYP